MSVYDDIDDAVTRHAGGDATEATPRRGLKAPWVKGQSGNPAGRPSVSGNIKARFGGDVLLILEKLKLIALKDNGPTGIMAAREFLDRVVGKVPQAIAVKAESSLEGRVIDITPEAALDRIRHASEVVERAKELGITDLPTRDKGPGLSVVQGKAQGEK